MLANPLPEERSGSSLVRQRGFAFLLRLFILVLAQQSFPLLRGWVGDSSALLKASALVGFLLAPQPALAQAVPAATAALGSTPGSQKVKLFWNPVRNASPAITKWQYQQKTGAAAYGAWTDIPNSADGQTNSIGYEITGLTNSTVYKFKVRAVNSAGNGAVSNETTATPTGTKTITLSTDKTNNRITEGDTERKNIVVTARLSEDAPAGGVDVSINSWPGSGTFQGNNVGGPTSCTNPNPTTADICFPGSTGAITIAAGARTATRTIGILPDTRDEPDEYFTMYASATDWAGDTIRITIVDNDDAPVGNKPAAPTGLSASAGDGQVDLSWDDPSDSSITKYQVRLKRGSAGWGGWAGIDGSDDETTSHTVTGLDNDVEYRFQIRARNANGNSPVSGARRATPTGSSSSTPTTTPLAAPVLTAAAGDKSVVLSWPDIAGEEITGWWYQYKSSGGWGSNIAVAANARKVVVRGLDNDTAYTFRIFARAGARQSVWSNQATATPSTGASGNVIISTPSLTVTEGSAGTYRTGSYTVALSTPPSSATTVTPSIGTNPANAMIEVSGALTFNSSNYNVPQPVTVTPVRDVDTTGTTSPITVNHTVSPTYGGNDDLSVSVTVIDRTPTLQLSTDPEAVQEGDSIRLTVSASRAFSGSLPVRLSLSARDSSGFNASDIPGGLGPREFTVEFGASGSTTGTVTISTSRDANTAEGDEAYEIRLEDATDNCCYAVGSDRTADGTLNDGPAPPSSGGGGGGGSSPTPEESEEEEQEPPAKPTGFTITPGNGQVTLSWADPSDATISKWQVQCKRADGSYGSWMDIPAASASTRGYTISGLTNGVSYECRIRAVNGAGPGPASDVVVVTPTDPDAARATRAREAAGVGLSRAVLSGATDVIGGRSTEAAPAPTTASSGSIGEQALGIVEELLGINGDALPTSLSMEGIGEQLWHQAFQLTPPPATSGAADGEHAQAGDSPAVQQRSWALWGAGNLQRFSGDDAQEHSSYEGNLKSAWVGIDQQFRTPWRGGIAASFSFGTTDYTYKRTSGEGAGGTMKSRLTSFYPYGSVQVNERLRLWGTAGLGFGELRHQESSTQDTDPQQEEQQGDLRMQLAVVGFAQQLSSIGTWDFALAGDLGLIKTSSHWNDHSGLEDLSITLTRARLGVDSSFPLSETTRGYVNLRGRLDGGEQQMGAAEAVAGLQYSAARLSALLQGRQTYAFNGDYSESGIMGQLLFSSQEDGTGLALELQPSYGHYGEGSAQQPFFFDDAQLQALTGQSTSQQDEGLGLKSMLGYGFRPHDNDLLLTPFAELSFSQGRRYLLGVGLNLEAPPWEVKLTGSREETGSSSPTGKVQLLFSTQL